MPSTSNEIVTTLFISNLHCSRYAPGIFFCRAPQHDSLVPSCVRTIQDALSALTPPPRAVDVSIVTQTVTVRHPQQLSQEAIRAAVDDAGFDIVSTPDVHEPSRLSGISLLPPTLSRNRLKHIQQCSQCQLDQGDQSPHDVVRDKLGEDTVVEDSPRFKNNSSLSDVNEKAYAAPAVPPPARTTVSAPQGPFNVTLSVGGMTCASCPNTLTRIVSELPGVSDVVINLLSNSAAFVVDTQDRVPGVVEAIEDAGYDADIITVESTAPIPAPRRDTSKASHDGSHRVTLSVGGMTCASCTNTVSALASEIPGVSDVVVNLIGKSATATLAKKELAEQLAEAIEDAGYEAEVVVLEPVGADGTHALKGPRTVDLRIEGMFCS